MTCRNICFTAYPNLDDPEDLDLDHPLIRYYIYQLEECPKTGRIHYQGYMELTKPSRFSALQKIPGLETAHFESRRGTPEQAREYCLKSRTQIEGPWEFGDFRGSQGHRTDLDGIYQMVKDGKNEEQILDAAPTAYMKFYRGIGRAIMLKTPKRRWKTEVTLLYGGPGLGKSYLAQEDCPDAYYLPPNNKWFDGYSGHADVILDDYSAKWMPYSQLKQLLDAYPMKVETKGGHQEFIARRIYITTNRLPWTWYDADTCPWPELERRIETVCYFTGFKEYRLFKKEEGLSGAKKFREYILGK